MFNLLNAKHQLINNRPIVSKVVPHMFEEDKNLRKYINTDYSRNLNHKYDSRSKDEDINQLKQYVGGSQNTQQMNHLARQYYQKNLRSKLEHEANLHNLRLGLNPEFYKQEQQSDSKYFEKIRMDFLTIINHIKSFNFSKDIINTASSIQNTLLTEGYNLTSSDLNTILENYSLCKELMQDETVNDIQDTKDSSNFQTLINILNQISEITKMLLPSADLDIRQRKANQTAINTNYVKELTSKKRVLEDFSKTSAVFGDKLYFDDRYSKILEEKAIRKKLNDELVADNKKIERKKELFKKFASEVKSTFDKLKRYTAYESIITKDFTKEQRYNDDKTALETKLAPLVGQLQTTSEKIKTESERLDAIDKKEKKLLSKLEKETQEEQALRESLAKGQDIAIEANIITVQEKIAAIRQQLVVLETTKASVSADIDTNKEYYDTGKRRNDELISSLSALEEKRATEVKQLLNFIQKREGISKTKDAIVLELHKLSQQQDNFEKKMEELQKDREKVKAISTGIDETKEDDDAVATVAQEVAVATPQEVAVATPKDEYGVYTDYGFSKMKGFLLLEANKAYRSQFEKTHKNLNKYKLDSDERRAKPLFNVIKQICIDNKKNYFISNNLAK